MRNGHLLVAKTECARPDWSCVLGVQDIIWNGVAQAAGAKVAIMYSDSADRWLSPAITSQGAAKRSLYIMLKHMSLPTDVVTEDDCVEGHLNHYAALFVVDAQISEAAVGAIGSWANAGGRAFITAGGGMLNEYNMTNEAMAALLPVKQEGIWTGAENSRRNGALPPSSLGSCGLLTDKLVVVPVAATIFFAKQDLPYAEKLDEATILATDTDDAYALGVFGDKSIFSFDPKPTDKAHVIGVFEDDSPAVVNVSLGTQGGGITYAGFHLGLSYAHPAMPIRPVDRTPSMESLTNFVPSDFAVGARTLAEVALMGAAAEGARPLHVSNPLVEVGFVTQTSAGAWNGTVLPL